MVLYKVLDANGRSCNGGDMQWSLPTHNEDGTWTPGEWMPEIKGPVVECENGYHLATLEQLVLVVDLHQLECCARTPAFFLGELNIRIIDMFHHPRLAGSGSLHSVKCRF